MRRFISWYEGETPIPEYWATEEAALGVARNREPLLDKALWDTPEKLAALKVIVAEVRDPMLSDFVHVEDILSPVRERMAQQIGNDDALSNLAEDATNPTQALMRMAELQELLRMAFNEWGKKHQLRIDGMILMSKIVHRRAADLPA